MMVTPPASVQAELPSGPAIAVALAGMAAEHAGSGGVDEPQPHTVINDRAA